MRQTLVKREFPASSGRRDDRARSGTVPCADAAEQGGAESTVRIVREGLTASPRHIASVFFYDAAGSRLFEQITRLPEYYPCRIETALLRTLAGPIAGDLQDADIVELGSGSCKKIMILLDALGRRGRRSARYIPVDVCGAAVAESAALLARRYPELAVHGIAADFLNLQVMPGGRKRLFCLFGGTLGNFLPEERQQLLDRIGGWMQAEDSLLLGIDLVKPREMLERAYNDGSGVTAAFNRNILQAVNATAGTDFEPAAYDHIAFYNEPAGRIEMHLKALKEMRVSAPGFGPLSIARGECIRTEYSYKFTLEQIAAEAAAAGLQIDSCSMDSRKWYAVVKISGNGRP